jgi:hypothetical protein
MIAFSVCCLFEKAGIEWCPTRKSQNVDSAPHCSARSGNRSRITNVTLSPPLLRAHNIRNTPSYSKTSFTALPGPGPSSQFECTGEYSATGRHTAVMRLREFELYVPTLGNFFTPLRRVEAASILCTIITRWALQTSKISGEVST